MNDYIAITTKVRAMRSKLITNDDIQSNQSLKSLSDIQQILLQTEGYNRAIKDTDMTFLTTERLIPMIHNGVYYTFLKLYHFANLNQRQILKLYGIKFEVKFIKDVLNNVGKADLTMAYFKRFTNYLEKSRGFNIKMIQTATTVSEVIDALENTIYADFFEKYRSNFQDDYFDSNLLNIKFDQFVALYIWKKARHLFNKKEINRFKKYYGSYIDLVNIESIYRLKFIYEIKNAEIKNYTLAPSRRLSHEVIDKLLHANSETSFERILESIGYAEVITNKKGTNDLRIEEEEFLERLLKFITRVCRESMLPILEYLEDKQKEAKLLIQTTEKIGWNKIDHSERESI